MARKPHITVYSDSGRSYACPDVDLKTPEPGYIYMPTRGFSDSLTVFDSGGRCVGWIGARTLGYESVRDWMDDHQWQDVEDEVEAAQKVVATRRSYRKKDLENVRLKTIAALLQGKRLHLFAHGRDFYLGSSKVDRPDPFWYEHPGGRTYKRTPEEVFDYLLPHVGIKAFEDAEVFNA
jgi:hypothetical protein